MDGGTWWAAVHGVAKSQTRLSDFTFTFHFHALEKEMATHSSVLAWRIPGMGSLVGCVYGVTQSRTRLKWLSSSSSSGTIYIIATKRIKYIGINLPKETKDRYAENYKTLMKEIKDYPNRWRDIPCSWIGKNSILKMTILTKATYRFSANPIQLTMIFFTELEKIISQIVWKHKRPQIAKAMLRKNNGAVVINFPDIRLYYKATVIKTVW